MNNYHKIALWISRILIGGTFIFSGFVKAIDPVGSSIKFEDYFVAFHLDFLSPYALMLGTILAAVEFLLGVNILLSLSPKQSSWYVLIMMSIMTPLTLYLALMNPVSDCGCFGDALKLTNWETFGKNVVLIAAAIFYFTKRNEVTHLYHHKIHWVPSLLSFIFALSIANYNQRHLPTIDFLPYKLGTNIPENMKVPEGAPVDKYETTFIYQKKEVRKEFTLENYPANDSTWHFVEQKSILVTKGVTPKIHDFSITLNSTQEDITAKILSDSSFTFLVVIPRIETAKDNYSGYINDIYDFCLDHHIPFYALTASSQEQIDKWANYTGAEYPFAFTDATALKTMIRANPGVVLLHNGTIVGKWNSVDLPNEQGIADYLKMAETGQLPKLIQEKNSHVWKTYAIVPVFLVIILMLDKLIQFFRRLLFRKKKTETEVDTTTNTNNK